ncbi:unnamed protein product [Ostreobium quekettii]|uniref:Vacuolar protein 8 n=1 Tax=Ostreobium quekettii TaxID=121088 RepID=A0A8S1IZ18_9CHLO|nr:unnamed protein product [Ostreobium quekettii]|eukprot:evm.model.scf_495.3 EVM.evm.TU.scf_495.3   scf_495:56196-59855(-)
MSADAAPGGLGMGRTLVRMLSLRSGGEPTYDRRGALLQGSCSQHQDVTWIVSQMRDGDESCQEQATALLADLAETNEAVLDAFINEGGLQPLIHILGDGSDPAKECATVVVAVLAQSPERGAAFVDAGGMKTLVGRPLTSKNAYRRKRALWATVKLMKLQGAVVVAQVAEFGGIPPLANLAGTGDKEDRKRAARALCILSEAPPPIPAIMARDGGVRVMLKLSEAISDKQRVLAARALAKFSEGREGQDELVTLGGIAPLLKMLGDPDEEECRCKAAYALANLSMRSRARRVMRRNGAINELVEVLEEFEKSPGEVAMAACALCNMAQEEGNRDAIVDRGAVPHLMKIVEVAEDGSQKMALAALGNLARSKRPRNAIVRWEGGAGVTLVVERLTDQDKVKVHQAVRLVANLAISRAAHETIEEAGAIRHMVPLVQSEWPETRRLVAGCLASLAVHPECKKDIVNHGAIPGLVAMLSGDNQEQAAYAIATLLDGVEALVPEIRESIVAGIAAGDGIPLLASLLASKSGYASLHAAHAVASLSESTTEIRKEIGHSEAVLNLADLLVEENVELRVSAVRALANLALVEGNQEAIAQSGCIRWLIHLLHTGDEKCRDLAASALSNVTFSYEDDQRRLRVAAALRKAERNRPNSNLTTSGTAKSQCDGASSSRDGSESSAAAVISGWFSRVNEKSPLEPVELDNLKCLPDRLLQAIAMEIGKGAAQGK